MNFPIYEERKMQSHILPQVKMSPFSKAKLLFHLPVPSCPPPTQRICGQWRLCDILEVVKSPAVKLCSVYRLICPSASHHQRDTWPSKKGSVWPRQQLFLFQNCQRQANEINQLPGPWSRGASAAPELPPPPCPLTGWQRNCLEVKLKIQVCSQNVLFWIIM